MARAARSLDVLLTQINAFAPRRSKVSDGGIGDPAHAARDSDHNPDRNGVFHARDFTHDPAGGFDSYAFADRLLRAQDPRLAYVISNGRIGSGPRGPQPGVWRVYTKANKHTKHAHVSVNDDNGDDIGQWAGVVPAAGPAPTSKPTGLYAGAGPAFPLRTGGSYRPGATGSGLRVWQQRMKDRGWRISVNGVHDVTSVAVCRAFQKQCGRGVTGAVDQDCWWDAWNAAVTK